MPLLPCFAFFLLGGNQQSAVRKKNTRPDGFVPLYKTEDKKKDDEK